MNRDNFVELVYDRYDGTDEMMPPIPPIVIIHGLFDTKANWSEIAKTIADRSVRMVYVIDLPNHGESPRKCYPKISNFVEDVDRFLMKIGEPIIIIAHSIGGTIAMDIALRKPNLVKNLILLDITPVRYPREAAMEISGASTIMRQALENVPPGINFGEAKEKVNAYLQMGRLIEPVRKMILPTLVKTDNGVAWQTNLDVIDDGSKSEFIRGMFPFKGCYNGGALIVRGELSYYVQEEDYDKVKMMFPKVKFQSIKNCNHWIHIERKDDLLNILLSYLSCC